MGGGGLLRSHMTQGADLMKRIEEHIEVNCPVSAAYNQWTQFEELPQFMSGIEEIRQTDDTHTHWVGEIWGKRKEWDAEITEQVPDEKICWQSTSGPKSAGEVHFDSLGPDRTGVTLAMTYEPDGTLENIGDALGVVRRQLRSTMKDFKQFMEERGRETGAWRGEVHGGKPQDRGRSTDA